MESGLIGGSLFRTISPVGSWGQVRKAIVAVVKLFGQCDVVWIIRAIVIRLGGREEGPVHRYGGRGAAELRIDGADSVGATEGKRGAGPGRETEDSCGFFVLLVAGECAYHWCAGAGGVT